MKFIAYMLAGVVFITALINPVLELLGAFSDMVKINSAVYASSRAAIMDAENEEETRNVESVIDKAKFRERFEEYLCSALDLEKKSESRFESTNGVYNDFQIEFEDEVGIDDKNSCSYEVITKYKFKTGLFKKYFKDINNLNLRIRRTQRFEITN